MIKVRIASEGLDTGPPSEKKILQLHAERGIQLDISFWPWKGLEKYPSSRADLLGSKRTAPRHLARPMFQ